MLHTTILIHEQKFLCTNHVYDDVSVLIYFWSSQNIFGNYHGFFLYYMKLYDCPYTINMGKTTGTQQNILHFVKFTVIHIVALSPTKTCPDIALSLAMSSIDRCLHYLIKWLQTYDRSPLHRRQCVSLNGKTYHICWLKNKTVKQHQILCRQKRHVLILIAINWNMWWQNSHFPHRCMSNCWYLVLIVSPKTVGIFMHIVTISYFRKGSNC